MVTTIQVNEDTKEMLDKLKVHYRESYNELLRRLTSSYSEEDKESLIDTIEIMSDPQTMRDIAQGLEDYENGKFKTLKEVEEELEIDFVEAPDLNESALDKSSAGVDQGLDSADAPVDEVEESGLEQTLEDVDLEFDELEEVQPAEELSLEQGTEEEEVSEEIQLDFSDIDISDLAPPADEEIQEVVAEELTLDGASDTEVESGPPPAPPARSSTGLEDLQVDGLLVGHGPLPNAQLWCPYGGSSKWKVKRMKMPGFGIDAGARHILPAGHTGLEPPRCRNSMYPT